MLAGTSKAATLQLISKNLEHPYDNPDFIEAVKAGDMNATRIRTDGISYGIGRTNSSFTALRNLTVFAVAEGWMKYWYLSGTEKGAKGFITFRPVAFPVRHVTNMLCGLILCQTRTTTSQSLRMWNGVYLLT